MMDRTPVSQRFPGSLDDKQAEIYWNVGLGYLDGAVPTQRDAADPQTGAVIAGLRN